MKQREAQNQFGLFLPESTKQPSWTEQQSPHLDVWITDCYYVFWIEYVV